MSPWSPRVVAPFLAQALFVGAVSLASAAPRLQDLRVYSAGFPKMLFFRACEGLAAEGLPEAEFDQLVNPALGVIGKMLDEELIGRSKTNPAYFARYKERNPKQLVLLHFNGLSHDPRFVPGTFFAGHWLHYNGCGLRNSLAPGDETLRVAEAALFRPGDEATLCFKRADGSLDWSVSEQVHLEAVDEAGGTLRVRRGIVNSSPRAWSAGATYIAAVVSRAPAGEGNDQSRWVYNYGADAPRDPQGRRLIEVLADYLGEELGPGGRLEAVDGVEFDMFPGAFPYLWRQNQVKSQGRGCDANGDGKLDGLDTQDFYSHLRGTREFLVQLRRRLGPDRLIMIDMGRRGYRGILNGIESEGWPNPFDVEQRTWSSGMNEHRWWASRAAAPRISYIHLKYALRRQGANQRLRLAPSLYRLVLAAAQMHSGLVTYQTRPDHPNALWDEMCKGEANEVNWLGQPLEAPRHLALESPDLFNGQGVELSDEFAARFETSETILDRAGNALRFRAKDATREQTQFRLMNVGVPSSECVLRLRVRGEPFPGVPDDLARKLWVWVSGETEKWPSIRDLRSRPGALWTWVDGEWFEARFYFRELKAPRVNFAFLVEGPTAVDLAGLTLHASGDAVARLFENGLVLANPSLKPLDVVLSQRYPGVQFQRIRGVNKDELDVNTGQPVAGTVTVAPREGLFLVRVP